MNHLKPAILSLLALIVAFQLAGVAPVAEAALPHTSTFAWRDGTVPTSSSPLVSTSRQRGGIVGALDRHSASVDVRRSARSAATVSEADIDLSLLERKPQIVLAAAGQGGLSPAVDLQAACSAGDANSCSVLGSYFDIGIGTGVERDRVRAAELYRQGCDGGDAMGCNLLGQLYLLGEGVEKDLVRAAELFREACDAGDMASCWHLGDRYSKGEGVDNDFARAADLYRQACDGGLALGCNALATLYMSGLGVEVNTAGAVELYKQACDANDKEGCFKLATLYSLGKVVEKDVTRAAELFRQVCNAGSVVGCYRLGNSYYKGEGVEKNQAKAAELYRRVCDAGSMIGCTELAYLYGRGEGVAKDLAHAAELYELACDSGFGWGCYNLGHHFLRGEGVTKDLARASALFRQACDRGVDEACKNLSRVDQALQADAARLALAARKDQLGLELAQRVDGWLSSSGVIDNVADAMQHDRLKTMAQLAAGKRIRVTVTPPSFSDGRFIIHNRVSAFNVDQAAGDTGFTWDRWLQTTQNFGQGVYTVVCRFAANQAGSLTEGTSIVVEATLVAAGTNDIVLDCAL